MNHPPSMISTKHLLFNMTICDDDLKQSNKLLGQYIITLTCRLLLNQIHRIKPNLLLRHRFQLQSRILELRMEDEDNLWRLTAIKQRPKAIVLGLANQDMLRRTALTGSEAILFMQCLGIAMRRKELISSRIFSESEGTCSPSRR